MTAQRILELRELFSVADVNELVASGQWAVLQITPYSRGDCAPGFSFLLGRLDRQDPLPFLEWLRHRCGEVVFPLSFKMTEERWDRMVHQGAADAEEAQILAEFKAAQEEGLPAFKRFITERLGLPWLEAPIQAAGGT